MGGHPKLTQDEGKELAKLKREGERWEWQKEGLAEEPAKLNPAREEERGEEQD